VIPIILNRIRNDKNSAKNIIFGNLKILTNRSLISDNSNFYYDTRSEQLDRRIRNDLNDYIISLTQEDLLMLLNNFLEIKDSDDSAAVVKRQAYYDGVLGARVIHEFQLYNLPEPIYDNNVYILISIYHGGTGTL
jgi:hypothetical protein